MLCVTREGGAESRIREMSPGIYLNEASNEILSVGVGEPTPDDGWTLITDDPRLGLVAARAIVVELGLTDDFRAVYWHMPQLTEAASLALLPEQALPVSTATFSCELIAVF